MTTEIQTEAQAEAALAAVLQQVQSGEVPDVVDEPVHDEPEPDAVTPDEPDPKHPKHTQHMPRGLALEGLLCRGLVVWVLLVLKLAMCSLED